MRLADFISKVYEYIKFKKVSNLKSILTKNSRKAVWALDKPIICQNYSLLGYACLFGDIKAVKLLLKHKASVNTTHHISSLAAAARDVDYKMTELLLDNKANIDSINSIDGYKQTPICQSVLYNRYNTVKLLINRGASLTVINPLKTALTRSRIEIIRLLVLSGCDTSFITETHLLDGSNLYTYQVIKYGLDGSLHKDLKERTNIVIKKRKASWLKALEQIHVPGITDLFNNVLEHAVEDYVPHTNTYTDHQMRFLFTNS